MSSSGLKKKKKIHQPTFQGNIHLESSAINLLSLREHGRNEFKNMISNTKGRTKHLIWDDNLKGPLNYIITPTILKDLGVRFTSGLQTSNKIESDCDDIIYITLPNISHMKLISKMVVNHTKYSRKINYYVFFLPHKTYLCEQELKRGGAYADIIIDILRIHWFPVDKDLLSMSINNTLSLTLNGNLSYLYNISKSLIELQAIFGKFDIVRAKGDLSCSIVDIMKRLMNEDNDIYNWKLNSNNISEITQCIIIDRTIDMVTPLLTPRTYEGLIDQVFSIKNTVIKVKKDNLGKSAQKSRVKGDMVKLCLNSSDNIFKQIRDTNFKYLGKLLSVMAQAIRIGYEDRFQAKTTSELNKYMKRFKNLHADHALVEQHIHLAEYIAINLTKKMKFKRKVEHELAILNGETVPSGESSEEYLEELIGKQDNIQNILKFMILISLCQGGISSKKYEILKKQIIQTYGLNYLFTLMLLEKYQLITKYDTFRRVLNVNASNQYINWNTIKNSFGLLKNEIELSKIMQNEIQKQEQQALNDQQSNGNNNSNNNNNNEQKTSQTLMSDPTLLGQYDLNLIGSGYAPLSARLVEAATKNYGWKGIRNHLTAIKGRQYLEEKIFDDIKTDDIKTDNNNTNNDNVINISSTHKTVLVFFVGGITYPEISAIRMLENRVNTSWRFVIATTNICNGNEIINSFIDKELLLND